MGKVQIPKKIRAEDFKSDDQALISKLSYPFNDLADSFYFNLNKALDFDNMNRDLINVNVNINATGGVANLPQVKYNLRTKPRGVVCVNAVNSVNPNIYPTQSPFVSWSLNSDGTLQILNVTGLQVNSQYILTLEIIG